MIIDCGFSEEDENTISVVVNIDTETQQRIASLSDQTKSTQNQIWVDAINYYLNNSCINQEIDTIREQLRRMYES